MQPHIHESVPCRLVLQLRTYRCNAVNRRFGPKSGREQLQQMQVHNADLLDYFVGTDE
jgi:hypothetical protein